jgi:hypothetical protein
MAAGVTQLVQIPRQLELNSGTCSPYLSIRSLFILQGQQWLFSLNSSLPSPLSTHLSQLTHRATTPPNVTQAFFARSCMKLQRCSPSDKPSEASLQKMSVSAAIYPQDQSLSLAPAEKSARGAPLQVTQTFQRKAWTLIVAKTQKLGNAAIPRSMANQAWPFMALK